MEQTNEHPAQIALRSILCLPSLVECSSTTVQLVVDGPITGGVSPVIEQTPLKSCAVRERRKRAGDVGVFKFEAQRASEDNADEQRLRVETTAFATVSMQAVVEVRHNTRRGDRITHLQVLVVTDDELGCDVKAPTITKSRRQLGLLVALCTTTD